MKIIPYKLRPNNVIFIILLGLTFISLLIVFGFSYFSEVTVTISAKTDTITWSIDSQKEGSPYVLSLPPGQVSVIEYKESETGQFQGETSKTARLNEPFLSIRGNATIKVIRNIAGEIQIIVHPKNTVSNDQYLIKLYDSAKLIKQFEDKVNYVSDCLSMDRKKCSGQSLRALIRANDIIIGDDLIDHIEPNTEDYLAGHSLVLHSGRLRSFSRAWFFGTRYLISSEELEAGDVIQLRAEKNIKNNNYLIWGSLSATFNQDDKFRDGLNLVAHTTNDRVEVRRFGGGYFFGATAWENIFSQPFLRFFWVTLVSILLLLTAIESVMQIAHSVTEEKNKANNGYEDNN